MVCVIIPINMCQSLKDREHGIFANHRTPRDACVCVCVWCALCVCVSVCEGELPSVQPLWVWYLVCVWCALCVCESV